MPPKPCAQSRASQRAYALIELLLKEMQLGMKNPLRLASSEWETIFVSKQSMVANLHKLVQAMATFPLNESPAKKTDKHTVTVASQQLSPEEMALLSSWIADNSASESYAMKPE